jgi:hypothetical protein
VPLKVYDETLGVLARAVGHARLGRIEKLEALRHLDAEARRLERTARAVRFASVVQTEWAQAPALGGRTVLDR